MYTGSPAQLIDLVSRCVVERDRKKATLERLTVKAKTMAKYLRSQHQIGEEDFPLLRATVQHYYIQKYGK